MDEPFQDPLTGQTLDGRYRVRSRVAVGGMATVYQALDTRLDRVIALKVMHPSLAVDSTFVERFIREAKFAAKLAHPNVVAVYDQGAQGAYVYLAMEYIHGCTLRHLLSDRKALQPRAVLDVLEPVLAALGAAHRAGLVHRDVKPENVLIGDDGRVKVADFGLVRAVDAQTSTSTTSVMGTVSYLAPELIEHGTAGTTADVYACGVMLYETLTGSKPHGGATPAQILLQHINNEVPPPSSLVPGLPRALDELVQRATRREPTERPADAVELLHDLREARAQLSAEELDAQPPRAVLHHFEDPTADYDSDTDETYEWDKDGKASVPGTAHGSGPQPPAPPSPLPHDASATEGAEGHEDAVTAVIARQSGAGSSADAPEHTSVLPPLPSIAPESAHRGYSGEDSHPPARSRWGGRSRRSLLALVGAVLLVLGLGTGVWYINSGQFTKTPSVLRLSQAAAEKKLTDSGLRVRVTSEHNATVDRGHVIESDPAPGARIRGNGTVTITVSRGPDVVKVPQLKGVELAEARKKLKAAGLEPATVSREFSESIDRGAVIGTDPKNGSERRPGAAVSLVVSKGPRIDVPDVTGMSAKRAQKELAEAGFEVKTDPSRIHSQHDAGLVARQSPGSGATRAEGDSVTITLSKGPEMVAVPDVVGKDEDDAVQELEDAGFEVTVRRFFFTGKVFNQSVDAGEQAAKGSTVTILIR